jgi:hypothetical protein
VNYVSTHNNNDQTAHLFGAGSSVPPTPSYQDLPDMPMLQPSDVHGMNVSNLRQVSVWRLLQAPRGASGGIKRCQKLRIVGP